MKAFSERPILRNIRNILCSICRSISMKSRPLITSLFAMLFLVFASCGVPREFTLGSEEFLNAINWRYRDGEKSKQYFMEALRHMNEVVANSRLTNKRRLAAYTMIIRCQLELGDYDSAMRFVECGIQLLKYRVDARDMSDPVTLELMVAENNLLNRVRVGSALLKRRNGNTCRPEIFGLFAPWASGELARKSRTLVISVT